MAFIAIELEVPGMTELQLNALLKDSSNAHTGVQELENLLAAVSGGAKDASVTVVVRSTTATLTASGGGSSALYNLA